MEQFKTFEEFKKWFDAPLTDVKDGSSEQLKQKQGFQRSMHEELMKLVKGSTREERLAAIEKIPYETRVEMVWDSRYGKQ